jgi:hypothetical protein
LNGAKSCLDYPASLRKNEQLHGKNTHLAVLKNDRSSKGPGITVVFIFK